VGWICGIRVINQRNDDISSIMIEWELICWLHSIHPIWQLNKLVIGNWRNDEKYCYQMNRLHSTRSVNPVKLSYLYFTYDLLIA
jgi:hypothetical protein